MSDRKQAKKKPVEADDPRHDPRMVMCRSCGEFVPRAETKPIGIGDYLCRSCSPDIEDLFST